VLRALALAALLAVPSAAARPAGGTPVLFVAVPQLQELVELDAGGAVLGRIHVERGARDASVAYPGAKPVVVVVGDKGVTIVDARTRRLLASHPGVSSPRDLHVVNPVRAYVIDTSRGILAVVDAEFGRIVGRLHVGARPRAFAFVPYGELWVVHGSGPVTVDGRRVPGTSGARDVAATRDGAKWIALPRRMLRIAPSGGHTAIPFAAAWLEPDDLSPDVFAADPVHARIVLLSPAGRIVHVFGGCDEPRAVATVGDVSVVAACRTGVAIYGRSGGAPSVAGVGGAPTGIAVAVL
jgi:hypothetical protein